MLLPSLVACRTDPPLPVAIVAGDDEVFYLRDDGAFHRRIDGDAWLRADIPGTPRAAALGSAAWVVLTDAGAFRSTDRGTRWTALPPLPPTPMGVWPQPPPAWWDVDLVDDHLYVTGLGGVLELRADEWTRVTPAYSADQWPSELVVAEGARFLVGSPAVWTWPPEDPPARVDLGIEPPDGMSYHPDAAVRGDGTLAVGTVWGVSLRVDGRWRDVGWPLPFAGRSRAEEDRLHPMDLIVRGEVSLCRSPWADDAVVAGWRGGLWTIDAAGTPTQTWAAPGAWPTLLAPVGDEVWFQQRGGGVEALDGSGRVRPIWTP